MQSDTTLSDNASMTRKSGPSVWVVLGDKPGDNAQVRAIEQSLPWPCADKHIQVLDPFVLGKPKVGPTLYHIDRELLVDLYSVL